MAENLNYDMPDSWCYDDDPENCAVYGRLYTWEAAKKACPECWHLPSEEEWVILERHLGLSAEEAAIFLLRGEGIGTKLKSKTGWEPVDGKNLGSNETGFNALAGGHRIRRKPFVCPFGQTRRLLEQHAVRQVRLQARLVSRQKRHRPRSRDQSARLQCSLR
jgi:uncharacterized protein (TIGR02145 family)